MSKPQQFALNFRPMKRREADTPKGAISDLFDQVGGVKEVQVRLGVGKSQAYAYTDPQSPEELSFARAAALTGPGASAAAEYLASRAGGVFCALPAGPGGCPMAMTADAVREHGEAVAAALEALTGKPTAAAKAKVRKELEESICAQAALLNHFREDEQ
jgi:hypothetical protein